MEVKLHKWILFSTEALPKIVWSLLWFNLKLGNNYHINCFSPKLDPQTHFSFFYLRQNFTFYSFEINLLYQYCHIIFYIIFLKKEINNNENTKNTQSTQRSKMTMNNGKNFWGDWTCRQSGCDWGDGDGPKNQVGPC